MKDVLPLAGIFLVLAAAGYWFIFGQASPQPTVAGSQATTTAADTIAAAPAAGPTASQPTTPNPVQPMQAILHTNLGDVTFEFDAAAAPTAVANFIKLAKAGFYDGTKFHRVIAGFMDQGGDPLSKDDSQMARWGTGGPGYQFPDENLNAKNDTGVVAMANSGPNTNGSQFFINAADNNFLDGKYTVFAKVVAGLNVVMAMNKTPTGANDRPLTPVVITGITLQ